jgi:hypothetical protein
MSRPWPALGWLPLAVVLSSCAGTPWGERLSGSFPPPQEPVPGDQRPAPESPQQAVDKPEGGQSAQAIAAPSKIAAPSTTVSPPGRNVPSSPLPAQPVPAQPGAAPTTAAGSRPLAPKGPPAPKSPATAAPSTSPSPSQPFPYRVTLRLPRADPSAPAEAVTQALRAAGIPFEVETIERVQGGATAPSARPAPPPR